VRLDFDAALAELLKAKRPAAAPSGGGGRHRAPASQAAADGAGWGWHLRMVHAAVAVRAPACAERHAALAAGAARHEGERLWAELFLVLLRERGNARLAPLRALAARRAAAPQALLQALLGLLQAEAEGGGEGGEAGEAEQRLAACIASAEVRVRVRVS